MTVNDEILFNHEIDQFGFASPQNANIDRTRHRGIESWFSWHPRPWVELYGSYTFDDSQIVRDRSSNIANLDGDQIPITPRNRGTLGTLFRLPYAFELGANMNVVGERYFANDLSNELGKFDGYTTVDLSAAWRPRLNEHLAFGVVIRMLNAFDHTYSEFAGERSFERDVIGYDPSPDRNYELGLEVTWRP
jgi:outer membrane receptor protein involved in Fe transport